MLRRGAEIDRASEQLILEAEAEHGQRTGSPAPQRRAEQQAPQRSTPPGALQLNPVLLRYRVGQRSCSENRRNRTLSAPVRKPLMRAHIHDEPQRRPASIPTVLLTPVHVLDDGVLTAEQFPHSLDERTPSPFPLVPVIRHPDSTDGDGVP